MASTPTVSPVVKKKTPAEVIDLWCAECLPAKEMPNGVQTHPLTWVQSKLPELLKRLAAEGYK